MGVALVSKRVMSYCQRRAVFAVHYMVKDVIQLYFTNKMEHFSLKWACCADCEAYKRRLAYSVTVRISENSYYIFKKFYTGV